MEVTEGGWSLGVCVGVCVCARGVGGEHCWWRDGMDVRVRDEEEAGSLGESKKRRRELSPVRRRWDLMAQNLGIILHEEK